MHQIFKQRRSVRQYKQKEITKEQVHNIICAAMVSPSGNHVNPWEFVVVRVREKLSKLGKCGKWQSFVSDCAVAIVVIAKESDTDMCIEDCSIASAHMYLEAANQGLGSCWANVREGLTEEGEDREQYVRDTLEIPSEYRVLNIMAIGYPLKEPPPHSEEEYDSSKVHEERFSS